LKRCPESVSRRGDLAINPRVGMADESAMSPY
jgi:hypothetical protein